MAGAVVARNREIYLIDLSGLTRLTQNNAFDSAPTWSPNGKQIAFVSSRDGNNEVYSMNADGTEQTNLTNNPAFDGGLPDWGQGHLKN